jgi:hypothetical protein
MFGLESKTQIEEVIAAGRAAAVNIRCEGCMQGSSISLFPFLPQADPPLLVPTS